MRRKSLTTFCRIAGFTLGGSQTPLHDSLSSRHKCLQLGGTKCACRLRPPLRFNSPRGNGNLGNLRGGTPLRIGEASCSACSRPFRAFASPSHRDPALGLQSGKALRGYSCGSGAQRRADGRLGYYDRRSCSRRRHDSSHQRCGFPTNSSPENRGLDNLAQPSVSHFERSHYSFAKNAFIRSMPSSTSA